MASSEAQLNDIEAQELDIFNELDGYDFVKNSEPAYRRNFIVAKLKARQQLALSDDSPFAHLGNDGHEEEGEGLSGSQQLGVASLRKETSQIREQLNYVKKRLQEIRSGQYQHSAETPTVAENNPKIKQQSAIVADIKRTTAKGARNSRPLPEQTKYRPLTGKADCPNCACDTRRRSICDLCQRYNSTSPMGVNKAAKLKDSPATKCYVDYTNDYDNRPIRPAKDRTLAKVEVSSHPTGAGQPLRETVDDVVVPGKVYTISKSLNDKRTKLAQAIDELQHMMEQVKTKSNKLEEERKLVQLYKEQWKYGPSIGGPRSSSRERLGLGNQENRNYESRLDANLARDSKSVMGFKHIEPSLKLRQYNKTPALPRRKSPPKKTQAIISRPVTSGVSVRSKSLESLRQVQKGRVPPHVVINENFQNGKASSEINLRKINEDKEEEEEEEDEVEEKIEDEMEVAEDENHNQITHAEDSSKQDRDEPTKEKNGSKSMDETESKDGRVARMTWIPVFGETEIKTVKKPATRKVQIMKPPPSTQQSNNTTLKTVSKSQDAPLDRYQSQRTSTIVGNKIKRVTITSPNSNQQAPRNDRVLNEANRKLRFASNLLEQEKNDCRNKNQLLVSKRTPSTPIYISREPAASKSAQDMIGHTNSQKQSIDSEQTSKSGDEMSESSRNELARIEEMVNEQQKLLNRLAQLQERQQVVSPVTVTYPSPCCMMHGGVHASSCGNSQRLARGRSPVKRSLLVSTLKDRLNKGKLQLARTLEQEREKHHQMRQRVDSSLRKQSDLQHENELLKQSLSKCIDTCLRDISSTFESLTDTLTDSVIGLELGGEQTNQQERRIVVSSSEDLATSDSSQVSALSHAAQFITDNKYLKQLKNHIEATELQRKTIFEELKREKQRSLQLETKLKESHSEMDHLGEIKRRLENELKSIGMKDRLGAELEPTPGCSKDSQPHIEHVQNELAKEETGQPSRSEMGQMQTKTTTSQAETENLDQPSSLEFDNSQSSIELYRKFIESMSPDIESLREERKLILSEFDNIKKMLSVMEQ